MNVHFGHGLFDKVKLECVFDVSITTTQYKCGRKKQHHQVKQVKNEQIQKYRLPKRFTKIK